MAARLFQEIIAFLEPEMGDVQKRQALVTEALYGSPVLQQVRWEGSAAEFTVALVELLARFGAVASGEPALAALLKHVKARVGVDRRAEADRLLAGLASAPGEPSREMPAILRDLLEAVRASAGDLSLDGERAREIRAHDPADLLEYRLCRIAEWSQPQHRLDRRFVNLTMIVDKGEHEPQRWQGLSAEEFRFNDLREVLKTRTEDGALVVLGAPGSGKSTLLRRLQLDQCADALRDGEAQVSFFVPLNAYREEKDGSRPAPREWLIHQWARHAPRFASAVPLERLLDEGNALLLLDALNEMPHRGPDDYQELLGQWQAFVQEAVDRGNRILFSCRKLDYSAGLSSEALRVPQIEVQPMTPAQVRAFLTAYAPEHQERIWKQLDESSQLEFFQTPYFLKLLCDLVGRLRGDLPRGRASLFTAVVRQAMDRQREKGDPLFRPGGLLDERDCARLLRNEWRGDFDLPERGPLIRRLTDLAWRMQERRGSNENSQVRIPYDEAESLLDDPRSADILKAGMALNVLDDDLAEDDIRFYHQLLQEYFAARRLAREPKPALVHVEWAAEKVDPPLAETLAGLNDGDPLPPIAQTGWEETSLAAAPMAQNPAQFIRALIPENLPLAARCAASAEAGIGEVLKRELRQALLARTQDMNADLRARIAAGEALGLLGDPRFEKRSGPHGDYLLPPVVEIPAGVYPMGDDNGKYDDEKPAHTIELPAFQLGQFPVTNAEYKCFLDAGGYDDEQWWDTDESKAWLRGEASALEGAKQSLRDWRKLRQGESEDQIRGYVTQNQLTSEEADSWIVFRNMTDERFEQSLAEWYPAGKRYRQPEYWEDVRFNYLSQPVVGVTWFEARAYCNWLTTSVGADDRVFRLPTEAEYEAAARGMEGRLYAYGNDFDSTRCNTFESHIRRTTPVGVFDNATPEGVYDLTGNVWTWTLSIYDQDRYPYPYRPGDGREAIDQAGIKRVLRGGSWLYFNDGARAVSRLNLPPAFRYDDLGFRLLFLLRPPSS